MVQKITVTRNKAGLEDLLFGVGTVQQTRGGQSVSITKINAQNLPFDETASLAEKLADINDAAALVASYGDTLDAIAANIAHLLTIEQVEIIGNDGNAGTLEGQTLAQVRAGIDAATLGGYTYAQVRTGVDAATLGGSNLAAVRAGIDAATLGGENLAAVKEGGNAATLEGSNLAAVRTGINAAQLEGSNLAAVRAGIDAATLGGYTYAQVVGAAGTVDATESVKGKVELADASEAKAGTASSVVMTPQRVAQHPLVPVAWGKINVVNNPNGTVNATITPNTGISSVSAGFSPMSLTVTLNTTVLAGFAFLRIIDNNGQVTDSKEFSFVDITSSSTINFGTLGTWTQSPSSYTCYLMVFGTRA